LKRRTLSAGVTLAAICTIVACGDVFGDAVQCRTDDDCASFAGAVCDTGQGVCVPAPTDDASSQPPSGPNSEGGSTVLSDAPMPPSPPLDAQSFPQDAPFDVDPLAACRSTTKPTTPLPATIATSMTLTCDQDWLLQNIVSVSSGATLTIQAGTTIKGDSATKGTLVVQPGAKIVAVGTESLPIVFTSSQAAGAKAAGDWNGLFILGNAPSNNTTYTLAGTTLTFGGAVSADNSGQLKYVRVEYGAYGVRLYGVGSATSVEYVQSRKTTHDAFRWIGGTVNAKHLATQYAGQEMFRIGSGYKGKLQFLVGQQTSTVDAHSGLLVDISEATIYGLTLAGSSATNQGTAITVLSGASPTVANAVATGWASGIDLFDPVATPIVEGTIVYNNATELVDTLYDAGGPDAANADPGFDIGAWFDAASAKNSTASANLLKPLDPNAPVFSATTAVVANAITPPNDGFFTTTATYVGAFKDANDTWATGAWAVWSSE
jgi:hypothetical protein